MSRYRDRYSVCGMDSADGLGKLCHLLMPSQSSNSGPRKSTSPCLLAIPAFDRIAGLYNRHLKSNGNMLTLTILKSGWGPWLICVLPSGFHSPIKGSTVGVELVRVLDAESGIASADWWNAQSILGSVALQSNDVTPSWCVRGWLLLLVVSECCLSQAKPKF